MLPAKLIAPLLSYAHFQNVCVDLPHFPQRILWCLIMDRRQLHFAFIFPKQVVKLFSGLPSFPSLPSSIFTVFPYPSLSFFSTYFSSFLFYISFVFPSLISS